ncbi:MAG: MoaD/ThiS family protein [Promethearchaeota archaeon]
MLIMFNIKILFLSLLEDIAGTKEITLSLDKDSTIKDILKKLITMYGKDFESIILNNPETLNKYIIISLNGRDIRSLEYMNMNLHNGDELAFLPAIAGG